MDVQSVILDVGKSDVLPIHLGDLKTWENLDCLDVGMSNVLPVHLASSEIPLNQDRDGVRKFVLFLGDFHTKLCNLKIQSE